MKVKGEAYEPIAAREQREQLMSEGFCIFEKVLEPEMIATLNAMSEWTIAQEDSAHFEEHRAQGCIIPYWKYPHPAFTELIAYPRAMLVLAELGFDHPKVWSGFVISKPPHSPPLYWHQDGVLWDHPISYTDTPQQYFLMYYLIDTNRSNGCLRVIPGSHLKRYPLHDLLRRQAHADDEVRSATDLSHPALQYAEREVDVAVKAGDVIIGDSRLLHSAHANRSDQRRTVLTIWYWPTYDGLPEEVKGLIADHITDKPEWSAWTEQTRSVTGPLVPVREGEANSAHIGREPGESLR